MKIDHKKALEIAQAEQQAENQKDLKSVRAQAEEVDRETEELRGKIKRTLKGFLENEPVSAIVADILEETDLITEPYEIFEDNHAVEAFFRGLEELGPDKVNVSTLQAILEAAAIGCPAVVYDYLVCDEDGSLFWTVPDDAKEGILALLLEEDDLEESKDPLVIELSKIIEIEGNHLSFGKTMVNLANFKRFRENLATIAESVSRDDLGRMIILAAQEVTNREMAEEFINNVKGISDNLEEEDMNAAIDGALTRVNVLEEEKAFWATLRPSEELPDGMSENSDSKEVIEAFFGTELGYRMLVEVAGVETLDEILKDEAIAELALNFIVAEFYQKGMHPLYFRTMMLALVNAHAEMVFIYFTGHPTYDSRYHAIYDPETVKVVIEVLQSKGHEASEDIFVDPGEVDLG